MLQGGQLPSTYMEAKRALAECASVDQCKEWSNKSAALASYAKQAKDTALFDHCTRIKARATQRMGELLKEVDAQGKRTDKLTEDAPGKLSQREAAANAGLSEHQQLQAVRVANVPKDEFDRLVEGDNPPSLTDLAGIGTKSKPTRRSRAEINAELMENCINQIEWTCESAHVMTKGKLSDTAPSEDQCRRIRDAEQKLKAIRTRSQTEKSKPEAAPILKPCPDGYKALLYAFHRAPPAARLRLLETQSSEPPPWLRKE